MPDLPTDLLFEADEWRAAFMLNKKPVPKQVPALNTVVRLIAQTVVSLAKNTMASRASRACGWECKRSPSSSRAPAMRASSPRHDLCVMGCTQREHCCMKCMRSMVSTANGGRPHLPSDA